MIDDLWYDRIAAVAIRYCVVSELLAPVLELSDFVLIPLSIAAIAVHAGFAARFALIANGYALPVTTFAIAALMCRALLPHARNRQWVFRSTAPMTPSAVTKTQSQTKTSPKRV